MSIPNSNTKRRGGYRRLGRGLPSASIFLSIVFAERDVWIPFFEMGVSFSDNLKECRVLVETLLNLSLDWSLCPGLCRVEFLDTET